jgi:hypothetical protein
MNPVENGAVFYETVAWIKRQPNPYWLATTMFKELAQIPKLCWTPAMQQQMRAASEVRQEINKGKADD